MFYILIHEKHSPVKKKVICTNTKQALLHAFHVTKWRERLVKEYRNMHFFSVRSETGDSDQSV